MKRLVLLPVLVGVLFGFTVASASADPGSNNPQVQYRTFSCDNGNTYNGGFVGFASGSFFIIDSTTVFAIKVFTEYFPGGGSKTFNYGIPGFDPSTLVTCQYTDPQQVERLLWFLHPEVIGVRLTRATAGVQVVVLDFEASVWVTFVARPLPGRTAGRLAQARRVSHQVAMTGAVAAAR